MRNPGKALLGLRLHQGEQEQITHDLARSWWRGQVLRVGPGAGVGPAGQLGWSARPPGGALLLLLTPQKQQLGFGLSVSCSYLPQLCRPAVIFSPL